MKPQVYIDPRPAEYFDRYHERARTQRPDWVYRLARVVLTPPILTLYRYRAIDVANVPERGPVLLAPNHFSYLDHFFVAVLLHREVQFMTKSRLSPAAGPRLHPEPRRTFPVRRGHRDEDAFITAHSIFDRGGTVLMPRVAGSAPRRWASRSPASAGLRSSPACRSCRSRSTAPSTHGRQRGTIPKVAVQFGAPLRYDQVDHPSRERSQDVAEQVFDRVRGMYDALT